jgi:hypothetical protein
MRKQESLRPDDLMKPDRVSELVLLGSGFVIVVLLLLLMFGGVAHL